jgi:hypothetical protein
MWARTRWRCMLGLKIPCFTKNCARYTSARGGKGGPKRLLRCARARLFQGPQYYVFPALGVSKRNLLKQNDLVCKLATRRPTIFYSHALGRCATGLPNVPSQYVYDFAS